MAAPASNKQSSPKIAETTEEKNEIRRAKKRKQKTNGGRAPQTEGYRAGLQADRVNQRGVDMLDFLDSRMVAAAPTATEPLREAMLVYVSSFTGQTQGAWHLRHITAKELALQPLNGSLRRYAAMQLDTAFYATRPVR